MPTHQVAAEGRSRAFASPTSLVSGSEQSAPTSQGARDSTPTGYQLSQHAMLRMAQRGIPSCVVEALVVTGKREHDGRGGLRIHLRHKAAQRRFASAIGAEAAARYRDVYAVVVVEGCIRPPVLVTVGRLRARAKTSRAVARFRRPRSL